MKYDFIEIGTSDFDTLIQSSNTSSKGISIEPLKLYLDNLPDNHNVIKSNYAVSNFKGKIDIYYVHPKKIAEYGLPYWIRGCNSIGAPHPTVVNLLKNNHTEIVEVEEVKVITWSDIISKYDVESVDLIKIDTEGHDHVILHEYYKICLKNPKLLANKIIFEKNILSNLSAISDLLNKFESLGYRYKTKDIDNYILFKEHYI